MPPQLREAALELHKALAVLMPDTIWLQSIAMLPRELFAYFNNRSPPHPSLPRMSHASQCSGMRIGCCSTDGSIQHAQNALDLFVQPAQHLLEFVDGLP